MDNHKAAHVLRASAFFSHLSQVETLEAVVYVTLVGLKFKYFQHFQFNARLQTLFLFIFYFLIQVAIWAI